MPSSLQLVSPQATKPNPSQQLDYAIEKVEQLKASFIASFLHGGLFIPVNEQLTPQTRVRLHLSILNAPQVQIYGLVSFIAPSTSSVGGHQTPGVGVAFEQGEAARVLVAQIEKHLTGLPDARPYAF